MGKQISIFGKKFQIDENDALGKIRNNGIGGIAGGILGHSVAMLIIKKKFYPLLNLINKSEDRDECIEKLKRKYKNIDKELTINNQESVKFSNKYVAPLVKIIRENEVGWKQKCIKYIQHRLIPMYSLFLIGGLIGGGMIGKHIPKISKVITDPSRMLPSPRYVLKTRPDGKVDLLPESKEFTKTYDFVTESKLIPALAGAGIGLGTAASYGLYRTARDYILGKYLKRKVRKGYHVPLQAFKNRLSRQILQNRLKLKQLKDRIDVEKIKYSHAVSEEEKQRIQNNLSNLFDDYDSTIVDITKMEEDLKNSKFGNDMDKTLKRERGAEAERKLRRKLRKSKWKRIALLAALGIPLGAAGGFISSYLKNRK